MFVDRLEDSEGDVANYNLLLKTLRDTHKVDASDLQNMIESILGRMKAQDVAPNDRTLFFLVSLLTDYDNIELAKQIVEFVKNDPDWKMTPSLNCYNSLMHGFAVKGDVETCLQLLKDMENEEIEPNVCTYATLIHACAEAKNLQTALDLFEIMKQDNVVPNTVAFNSLIQACSETNNLGKALELLHKMKHGLQSSLPDVKTYTSLILLCMKVKEWDRAFQLLEEMKQQRIYPNKKTYTSMIAGFSLEGNLEKCYEVFEMMRRDSVMPDSTTFYYLILSCLHDDSFNLKKAFSLLSSMRKDYSIVPTNRILQLLIKKSAEKGKIDKILKVLEKIESVEGLVLDKSIYDALIYYCGQNNQLENAFLMYEKMLQADIQVDATTSQNLIAACLFSNNHGKALEILDSFLRENENSGNAESGTYLSLFNLLFKHFQHDIEKTLELIQKMRQHKVPPDSETFNIIISAYEQSDRFDEIFDLLREMRKEKEVDNWIIYNSFINAYLRKGDFERVLGILDQMRNHNVMLKKELILSLQHTLVPKIGTTDTPQQSTDLILTKVMGMIQVSLRRDQFDMAVFLSAVELFSRLKNHQKTLEILQTLEQRQLYEVLDRESTNRGWLWRAGSVLLNGYVLIGDVKQAESMFKFLQEKGARLSTRNYNLMISLYRKQQDISKAMKILEEMKQHGVSPDLLTYTNLIDLAAVCGNLEITEGLVEDMKKLQGLPEDNVEQTEATEEARREQPQSTRGKDQKDGSGSDGGGGGRDGVPQLPDTTDEMKKKKKETTATEGTKETEKDRKRKRRHANSSYSDISLSLLK